MKHPLVRSATTSLVIVLSIWAIVLGWGVWKFQPDELVMDEPRYVEHLRFFLEGRYFDPADPEVVNGPGYPAALLLAYRGGENFLAGRLLNIPFLIGASLFLYFGARRWLPDRAAFVCALAIAFNPIQLRFIHLMMTDTFSVFLFCGFAWATLHALEGKKRTWCWIIGAALFLWGLTMTRVIFGYVMVAGIVALPVATFLLREKFRHARQMILILALSLALCIPYLVFTHRVTGEFFSWSTTGGEFLYWIGNPHKQEFGDWMGGPGEVEGNPALRRNHGAFFKKIAHLPRMEQDAAMAEQGKTWIKEHPGKLVRNVVVNGIRVFSGFPRSYQMERPGAIFWAGPIYLILFLLAGSIVPAVRRWRTIPFSLKALLLLATIYVGGTLLLPAVPRYLLPVFPAVNLWLGYVYSRVLEFRLR